jgi:hypothetical protein
LAQTRIGYDAFAEVPTASDDSVRKSAPGWGDFGMNPNGSDRADLRDLTEVEAWLALRRSTPVVRAQSPDVMQRGSLKELQLIQAAEG